MKTTFVLLFCFFLPTTDCYDLLYTNGLKAFNNRQFSTAIQKFNAAKDCPGKPRQNDLDAWISKSKQGLRERQSWNRAVQADAPDAYQRYIDDYPQGYYAGKAHSAMERLKKTAEKPVLESLNSGFVDWTQHFVEATGKCAIDLKMKAENEAQALLMATRGAELTAKSNLLETAQGIRISRSTTVRDFMTKSDLIKGELEGTVKGARQVGEPLIANGTVTVTMRMPIYGSSALASVVKQNTPDETKPPLPDSSALELVIQFPDGPVKPVLQPVIVDELGQIIYSSEGETTPVLHYVKFSAVNPEAVSIDMREDEQGRWVAPQDAVPLLQTWMNVRKGKGEALPLRVVL